MGSDTQAAAFPGIRIPAILLCAISWAVAAILVPDPVLLGLSMVLAWLLLLLSLIDIRLFILPDPLVAGVMALGVLPVALGWMAPAEGVIGGLLFAGTGWLVRATVSWMLGREALGLGDVKLMAAAGLWLGPAALPIYLLAASLLGLVFATFHRSIVSPTSGSGAWTGEIPFGPALALALQIGVMLHLGGHVDLRDAELLVRMLGLA